MAKASIAAQSGNNERAANHVGKAFEAAQIKKSGFRFHQNLGLMDTKTNRSTLAALGVHFAKVLAKLVLAAAVVGLYSH